MKVFYSFVLFCLVLNGCSPSIKNMMYSQKPSTWREPVEYNFILLKDGKVEKSFKPMGMKGNNFIITTENEGEKEILKSDVSAFQDAVAFYRSVEGWGFVTRRVRGAINVYSAATRSYTTPGTGKYGTLEGMPTTHYTTQVFIERNNDGNLLQIGDQEEHLILVREWVKDSPAALERLAKVKAVKVLGKKYVSDKMAIGEAIEIYDKEHPEVKNLLN